MIRDIVGLFFTGVLISVGIWVLILLTLAIAETHANSIKLLKRVTAIEKRLNDMEGD